MGPNAKSKLMCHVFIGWAIRWCGFCRAGPKFLVGSQRRISDGWHKILKDLLELWVYKTTVWLKVYEVWVWSTISLLRCLFLIHQKVKRWWKYFQNCVDYWWIICITRSPKNIRDQWSHFKLVGYRLYFIYKFPIGFFALGFEPVGRVKCKGGQKFIDPWHFVVGEEYR